MDKLTAEQQVRAVALEAAARVVAENLGKFVNLGTIANNQIYTKLAVRGLAKDFEGYVRDGAS